LNTKLLLILPTKAINNFYNSFPLSKQKYQQKKLQEVELRLQVRSIANSKMKVLQNDFGDTINYPEDTLENYATG
jgi:membrane-associated HD superfamily phosphohydrolase